MSIDSLLNDLVNTVNDATGAILVASDGEAVQWGATAQSERLRLRSAYIAVVMQQFRPAATRAALGHLRHLVVEYEGATLIAQEIDKDCLLILELKANASVSRALHRMQPTIAKLREELSP